MAVTRFQSEILKLIARSRIAGGETYVAGGLALNHQLRRPRVSEDIDVFNSSYDALVSASDMDRSVLVAAGYEVVLKRERNYVVEVTVSKGGETTDIQWVQDSAYRFFPLITDDLLGLTLHPFDLATNKLLALAGRRVPRDWVDTITCAELIQPLAFLAWAANGKDQGLTPNFILDMCSRTTYVQKELDMVIRSSEPVDAAALSRRWHGMIERARETVKFLPPEEVGKVVMTREGDLFRGTDDELKSALQAGEIVFHEGVLGGAWPMIVDGAFAS